MSFLIRPAVCFFLNDIIMDSSFIKKGNLFFLEKVSFYNITQRIKLFFIFFRETQMIFFHDPDIFIIDYSL